MDRRLLSIVIPEYNEAECLPKLHTELRRACDPLPFQFEFLFVDDGSSDNSLDVLAGLHALDSRVHYLALSRNFGHQAALSAGLAYASGDAVIMMDGDLQHPPELIPVLLERWQAGFDVVNTSRTNTEGVHPLKRLWSFLFYPFFNWVTRVGIEPGGADFRLMDRAVVDELNALPERHRFLRGLVPWLGFRQTKVVFKAPRRFAGTAKLSFMKNVRFALDGLTSFSFFPLRSLSFLGWSMAGTAILYCIFALALQFTQVTLPGWSFLVAAMVALSGFQIGMLGLLGEYIGRIMEQVKGRPLFIIREAVGLPAQHIGRLTARTRYSA